MLITRSKSAILFCINLLKGKKNHNPVSEKKIKTYFNNGMNPLEQNTSEIYNQFYSDRDTLEAYFNDSRLGFYQSVLNLATEKNLNLNEKDIADFGCGSGHLLELFCSVFKPKSSTGFDFSKSGIDYAKKTFENHLFFVKDIYENITPNTYDFIMCTEVLEHLEYPDRALWNMLNSLKNNGILLLTVPNGRIDTIEEHINFWSPESWKIFIENTPNSKHKFSFDISTIIDNKVNYAIIQIENI